MTLDTLDLRETKTRSTKAEGASGEIWPMEDRGGVSDAAGTGQPLKSKEVAERERGVEGGGNIEVECND